MKKAILLTLTLLLFIVPISFAEDEPVYKLKNVLKIGFDTTVVVEPSVAGSPISTDIDSGFSVTSELSTSINTNLDIGAGATFQLPRQIKGDDSYYYFIPIYGLVRMFPSPEQDPFYLTGHVGWNYFHVDEPDDDYSGGLYLGVGAGYMTDRFLIEALYSINNGKIKYSEGVQEFDYTSLSLSVGVVF